MKILFFTDPHNSDTPPRMRKDNYMEAILKKQEELIIVAKTCDMVVVGGDIFHKKDPTKVSFKLVHRVMDIYREYPNLHVLMGNHDYMNSPSEAKENHFGMLGHLPNVHLHLQERVLRLDNLSLHFIPYLEGIDAFTDAFDRGPLDKCPKAICFAHAPVSPVSLPFEHIPLDRVKGIFDYLFCGHFHSVQSSGNGFGNPGALSRGTLLMDSTFDRSVGALLITIDKQIDVVFCSVPKVPADMVFKIDDAMQKRELTEVISEFVAHIADFEVPIALSREDLINKIDSMPIDIPVREKAKMILERL